MIVWCGAKVFGQLKLMRPHDAGISKSTETAYVGNTGILEIALLAHRRDGYGGAWLDSPCKCQSPANDDQA